jgi:hypothetical protein
MSMACQKFPLDGSPDISLTTRNRPGLTFQDIFCLAMRINIILSTGSQLRMKHLSISSIQNKKNSNRAWIGSTLAHPIRRISRGCHQQGRWWDKLIQRVLLLHDNASTHTSQVAMTATTDCGFEILPHPTYSSTFGKQWRCQGGGKWLLWGPK